MAEKVIPGISLPVIGCGQRAVTSSSNAGNPYFFQVLASISFATSAAMLSSTIFFTSFVRCRGWISWLICAVSHYRPLVPRYNLRIRCSSPLTLLSPLARECFLFPGFYQPFYCCLAVGASTCSDTGFPPHRRLPSAHRSLIVGVGWWDNNRSSLTTVMNHGFLIVPTDGTKW